jgi:hypothetical protein
LLAKRTAIAAALESRLKPAESDALECGIVSEPWIPATKVDAKSVLGASHRRAATLAEYQTTRLHDVTDALHGMPLVGKSDSATLSRLRTEQRINPS